MSIEILYREILHIVEHCRSELAEEALSDERHELSVKHHRGDRDNVQHHKENDERNYLTACPIPVACLVPYLDNAEYLLLEYRGNGRNSRRENDTYSGDNNHCRGEFIQHFYCSAEGFNFDFRLFVFLIHYLRLLSSAVHILRGKFQMTSEARREFRCRQSYRCQAQLSCPRFLPTRYAVL